ncbi:hypothetical protein EIK77_008493 [Talaromyces pinophilus]|nr:hypothetical protein EIK77_008493 [Talaromyces pinophilus]
MGKDRKKLKAKIAATAAGLEHLKSEIATLEQQTSELQDEVAVTESCVLKQIAFGNPAGRSRVSLEKSYCSIKHLRKQPTSLHNGVPMLTDSWKSSSSSTKILCGGPLNA